MRTLRPWSLTLVPASCAVAFAALGLVLVAAPPAFRWALLAASLVSTTFAFGALALRVRHLEAVNEGLVEELAQELSRVRDRVEVMAEGVAARERVPDEAAATRRIVVK